jgi:hypothetical protein
MPVGRLGTGERIALAGGLLLAVCVFLPWYETSPDNPNATIDGARGALSAWEVYPVMRWLFLAAAAAPFILAWVTIREHELSWPRGEMTAVTSVAAFGLVAYTGFLDRPGAPNSAISIEPAFLGALPATMLMIAGSAMTAGHTERTRKPPGVL